jgi:hypothetical protein
LIDPDVSALEKILKRKIHIFRVDELGTEGFGAKGRPF